MDARCLPHLGIGVGLRPCHYKEIFSSEKQIDWFEIISENFICEGGAPLKNLARILEDYPVVMHGVSLGIGSTTALNWGYLKKLKELQRFTSSPWVSDHLCWGQQPGKHFHDLLPLPLRKDVADFVVEKAKIIQDYLEVPFALENVSSYAATAFDEMTEWEFYSYIVEKADILMMLDVNNVYVSSYNHGFSPEKYLSSLPIERVIQMHLAGHTDKGSYLLDTHDQPVCDKVWELYGKIWPKTCQASTLLEWDDNFLNYEDTCKEAQKAKHYQASLSLC